MLLLLLLPLPLALLVPALPFTARTWPESLALAQSAIANLTVREKVDIITGVGQLSSRCVGNTHAIPRVGIPSICLNDGPAGVRATKNVTAFPPGINAASTFSRRLMRARGRAIAEEFKAKGIHVYLGPAMDIMRNGKAGRGWESFGPDPWLTGEASYETIVGIQSVGVQACAKHLIANYQEHNRFTYNAELDDRTSHEVYLWPFLRAIEANVSSIMCAYNRVNGTYACGNSALMGNSGFLLKNGFQGYFVSDWGGTHGSAEDSANAGLDMEQPGNWIVIGGGVFGGNLERAVAAGRVGLNRLNEMVTRVLGSWYRLGQDQNFPPTNFNVQSAAGRENLNVNVRTTEHTALVREIAAASTVLLKNTNSLPLQRTSLSTLAVIGLDAGAPDPNCSLDSCNRGVTVTGYGSGSTVLDNVIPPIVSLRENALQDGTAISQSLSNDPNAGKNAAQGKDAAIVFVNAFSGENPIIGTVEGTYGDRNDYALFNKGAALIQAVASVNPNTIVVIHSVGPVLLDPWCENANVTAIVYAGLPGEQAGPAIVDILYGVVNPSGRLPFTIASDSTHYNTDIYYGSIFDFTRTVKFTEGVYLDYRYFDASGIKPRYEFGFGLSYTTFDYGRLELSKSTEGASVSFQVTNNGTVGGAEIPQLYIGFPTTAGEPPKVLRGFDDVSLRPGESNTVRMELNSRDLSVWDPISQSWTRPDGIYKVYIGSSSKDIRLVGQL